MENTKSFIRASLSLKTLAISAGLAVLFAVAYLCIPVMPHWHEIFRPSALTMIQGQNPYDNPRFFDPPWALLALLPFAVLPEPVGNALLICVTYFSFGFVAHRMGAKPLAVILFLTLPSVVYNLFQVNIEWLVVLGFLCPPQIGLFLVLLKPQIGFFVAVFWFVAAWRSGGVRKIAWTFGPVSLAFLLSFALYGPYFTKSLQLFLYDGLTLLPYTIPLGLVLFVQSLRLRRFGFSVACAPFLTPYIQPYSLPFAILGLLPDQLLTVVAIAGYWMIDFKMGYIQRMIGLVFGR